MLGRSSFLLVVAATLLALLPSPAQGSIARALALSELVAGSDQVVSGTALEATSRWEQIGGSRRIVTYTRVRVDETLAGASPGPEMMLRTLGGTVGKVGQVVHGEALLLIGESAVLFTGPAPDGVPAVVGMSQGHFPLRADKGGVRRLSPSPRGFELYGKAGALAELNGKSLDDARSRIRRAWDAR
jgi:hypothetical protein